MTTFDVDAHTRSAVQQMAEKCNVNETEVMWGVLRELTHLSFYANGWPYGTAPGATESEVEGWDYPGGADMVDAVNEMLTRLCMQVPTPEDDGAVVPDEDDDEDEEG